ncbi:unnamed protein product, partial [Musa textilis]
DNSGQGEDFHGEEPYHHLFDPRHDRIIGTQYHKAPSLRDGNQSNSSRSGKRNTSAANFVAGGDAGLQPRDIAVNTVRRGERFAAEEEEEDINEVADAFIRRFREQLQLRRLQSIENYNQMLARDKATIAKTSTVCQ